MGGAGILAADPFVEMRNSHHAGENVAPVIRFVHTEAQPSGAVGLLNGTSVPGTERDTERIELDSHWNNSRNCSPFRRSG